MTALFDIMMFVYVMSLAIELFVVSYCIICDGGKARFSR